MKLWMRVKAIIIAIVVFDITLFAVLAIPTYLDRQRHHYESVSINDDADLGRFNRIFGRDGSHSKPYVIENLMVENSFNVGGTTKHVDIQNVTILHGTMTLSGNNIAVDGLNVISGLDMGGLVIYGRSIRVSNSIISNASRGIYVDGVDVVVDRVKVSYCSYSGVDIQHGKNVTFSNSTIDQCSDGIFITEMASRITIDHCTVSNTSQGIWMSGPNGHIKHSNLVDDYCPIRLESTSTGCIIESNNIVGEGGSLAWNCADFLKPKVHIAGNYWGMSPYSEDSAPLYEWIEGNGAGQ